MDGLKINIAGVANCGNEIKDSAVKIGELLDEELNSITELGSVWRDENYNLAAEELKKNIEALRPLQEQLVSLGSQLVDISEQYTTNKNRIRNMFS